MVEISFNNYETFVTKDEIIRIIENINNIIPWIADWNLVKWEKNCNLGAKLGTSNQNKKEWYGTISR
jgi:hypothetical protein